jgi:hypothetical protein|tara:strand:- start:387 stop:824 length:438 start_codon:yes stop_codon:yes gene_type:complete
MNFIKNDLSVYKKVMGEFGSKEPIVNEIKSGTFSEPIRKRSLINKIYKKIKPRITGFFRDNDWRNVSKIWKELDKLDLDWYGTENYYGVGKYDKTLPPERKTWKFEINFINQNNRSDRIYGYLVAAGSGKKDDPLERYDITVVMS